MPLRSLQLVPAPLWSVTSYQALYQSPACCGFSPVPFHCSLWFIPPSWFCPCVSTACCDVFTELRKGNAAFHKSPVSSEWLLKQEMPSVAPELREQREGGRGGHGWEWGRKWNCPHPATVRKRVISSCAGAHWGLLGWGSGCQLVVVVLL